MNGTDTRTVPVRPDAAAINISEAEVDEIYNGDLDPATSPSSVIDSSDESVLPSHQSDSRPRFSLLSTLVPLIVLLIGVGCSLGLYFWFQSVEIDKFDTNFAVHCEDQALELKHGLRRNLETVQDYSALLNTYSSSINQTQFSTFGQSSAWNASEIRHLIFRPRVDRRKRSQWEQDHNQIIVVRGMDGKPVRAPDDDVYFPTTLKLYAEEPQPWSGYDLYSPISTRLALQRVQATRNPTLTDAISLVNQKKGILIIYPLNITSKYQDSNVNNTLSGVITAAYDVEHIFSGSFSRSSTYQNMQVTVYDKNATNSEPLFVSRSSPQTLSNGLRSSSTIDIMDRTYEIECIPLAALAKKRNSYFPVVFLILTLLVTLLVTGITYAFVRRYETVKEKEKMSKEQLIVSKKIVDSLSHYARAIVKFLPDPLLFVGDGVIKGANEHFLFKSGYTLEDFSNTVPITDIIPSYTDSISSARESVEATVRRADGSSFPAEISISEPFHDARDPASRQVILLRDMTERNRVLRDLSNAKFEAQKANESKTAILYFLCHEIRNPLHVMLGLSSTLDIGSPEDLAESKSGIYSATTFLISLVDDILSLLNVKAGTVPMKAAPVDFKDLIARIRREKETEAFQKGLHFELETEAGDIEIEAVTDEYRLHQCLSRILDHSIRVTPEGGKVTFCVKKVTKEQYSSERTRTTSQSDYESPSLSRSLSTLVDSESYSPMPSTTARYLFAVDDTANGYTPSEIPSLFDPFNPYISASLGKEFGGVGLGLAIAKLFVGALGGQLHFASKRGRGNHVSFELEFPITEKSKGSPSSSTELNLPSTVIKYDDTVDIGGPSQQPLPPRILLVEDNAIVQKVTSKLLKKSGFDVVTADHGQQAIDIISSDPSISVILMDLIMPVLNGHDATIELRSRQCDLPIIALTANALHTEAASCEKEGFDDFITKPLTAEDLEKVVRHWVEKKHSI